MFNKIKGFILPFLTKYLSVFSTFMVASTIYYFYLYNFRINSDPPEFAMYIYLLLGLTLTPFILLLIFGIEKLTNISFRNYFIFGLSLLILFFYIVSWEYANSLINNTTTTNEGVAIFLINNDITMLVFMYILFFTLAGIYLYLFGRNIDHR